MLGLQDQKFADRCRCGAKAPSKRRDFPILNEECSGKSKRLPRSPRNHCAAVQTGVDQVRSPLGPIDQQPMLARRRFRKTSGTSDGMRRGVIRRITQLKRNCGSSTKSMRPNCLCLLSVIPPCPCFRLRKGNWHDKERRVNYRRSSVKTSAVARVVETARRGHAECQRR